jgi:hypothetical protein
MTSDDLFLLFDRYGEVVDIHIPRDRRWAPPDLALGCFAFRV